MCCLRQTYVWPEREGPRHVDLPIHAVSIKEGKHVLDTAYCKMSVSITSFAACPIRDYQSMRTLVPQETRFYKSQ